MRTTHGPAPQASPYPGITGWLLLLLNWLVPGAGFWLCRRRGRAVVQFLLVMVTFALGLSLHSGVAWPSWSPSAPDFNLINNFTLVIQFGAGLPALASLLAQPSTLTWLAQHFGGIGLAQHATWTWLAGTPQHAYYELGGYFMIVAGAINYFAVCNLYDRVVQPKEHFAAQEQVGEEKDAISQP